MWESDSYINDNFWHINDEERTRSNWYWSEIASFAILITSHGRIGNVQFNNVWLEFPWNEKISYKLTIRKWCVAWNYFQQIISLAREMRRRNELHDNDCFLIKLNLLIRIQWIFIEADSSVSNSRTCLLSSHKKKPPRTIAQINTRNVYVEMIKLVSNIGLISRKCVARACSSQQLFEQLCETETNKIISGNCLRTISNICNENSVWEVSVTLSHKYIAEITFNDTF